jgi:hypothetical protein
MDVAADCDLRTVACTDIDCNVESGFVHGVSDDTNANRTCRGGQLLGKIFALSLIKLYTQYRIEPRRTVWR